MSAPQESDPKNNFRRRDRRSYVAHTLFTHKFTCVHMLTLRDSRNPPLDLLTGFPATEGKGKHWAYEVFRD